MARKERLITVENLRVSKIRDSFSTKPHKFYVIYDEDMDELIVKLINPEEIAVEFPLDDKHSYLVDPSTFEVVGFEFINFSVEHLQHMPKLKKSWNNNAFVSCFNQYQELDYVPMVTEQEKNINYFFMPVERIEPVLEAC